MSDTNQQPSVTSDQLINSNSSPVDGLNFDINPDTGEITIIGSNSGANQTTQTTQTQTEVNPLQTELNDLKQKFSALSSQNELLIKAITGQQQNNQTQQTDVFSQLEGSDEGKQLSSILKTGITDSINKIVQPLQEKIMGMQAQLQVHNMAATDPGFHSRIPQIQQIMNLVPGIDLQKANELAKVLTPTSTQTDRTEKSAQDLINKSNKLNLDSDTGVNSQVVNNKIEIKSVKDALNAAVNEIYGSGNKR